MTSVDDINQFMDQFAPSGLAADWDNIGLLVGDLASPVQRVMTCLTITPESADEAVEKKVDLIITHHPLPFRPLTRLTTAETASRLLLKLIKADISVISPHTAFDSTDRGINAMLAERLELSGTRPLVPSPELGESVGTARVGGTLAGTTLRQLIATAKNSLGVEFVKHVGPVEQPVNQVAVCCGSGGSFLESAIRAGCDAMVTGEATFHTCLEASANNVALLLLGHHTSERFAVEVLAKVIKDSFEDLTVWASEQEVDPVRFA